MTWAQLDDQLANHPKIYRLRKQPGGHAAIGLWTLTLTWAHAYTRDKPPAWQGVIPQDMAYLLGDEDDPAGTTDMINMLVVAGLWDPLGDDGWRIHDFRHWQDLEKRERASAYGKRGAATRWHGQSPDPLFDLPGDTTSGNGTDTGTYGGAIKDLNNPHPNPIPTPTPKEEPNGSSSSSGLAVRDPDTGLDTPGSRTDVERICDHLADRVEQRYGKRPRIGKRWRTAARLMLDADGLTETQVHSAIDWCQAHEFWAPNVQSVPKLREKYIQLRAQAQRDQASGRKPSTTDARVMTGLDLAEKYAAEERAALTRGTHDEVTDGAGAGEGGGIRPADDR